GVVADREDKIQRRRAGPAELAPTLRAHGAHVEVHLAQEVERVWMQAARRLAARRMGAEMSATLAVEDGLRHDRAGGVAGAEEQDLERLVHQTVSFLVRFALAGAH